MNEWHGTRRIVLGALVAVLGILAAAGGAPGANAEAKKGPDYGSKETFAFECTATDGVFIDDEEGDTECYHDDGGHTDCDSSGNDCWYTPPKRAEPVGPRGPHVGTGGQATLDGGETGGRGLRTGTHVAPADGQVVAATDES